MVLKESEGGKVRMMISWMLNENKQAKRKIVKRASTPIKICKVVNGNKSFVTYIENPGSGD